MHERTRRAPTAPATRAAPAHRAVAAEEVAPPASPQPLLGFERGVARRWAQRIFGHLPIWLVALGVFLVGSPLLAVAWYAVCRLAYVGYVTSVLRALPRRGLPQDHAAREALWARFRTRVSWVMDNDAAAFVALCLVTRGTLHLPWPTAWVWALGSVLGFGGLAVRAWATASLPPGSYYWRNFFFPPEHTHVSEAGPYRWFRDPMYSLGYAPLYGLALVAGSLPGLVAAAAAQAAVLLLAAFVERPALARV